jgi:hypothetical protein
MLLSRRVTFDAATWHTLDRLANDGMKTIQEIRRMRTFLDLDDGSDRR